MMFEDKKEAEKHFKGCEDGWGNPAKVERCPICKKWGMTMASEDSDAEMTGTGEYGDKTGITRACLTCQENLPD